MRLGKRSIGNLTIVATGPFFSLAGKISDSRENSPHKDKSFHSSGQSRDLLPISFQSKKDGKDVFAFKRRLMTSFLIKKLLWSLFLFTLHCFFATRAILNIMSSKERTYEVNTRTERDEQLFRKKLLTHGRKSGLLKSSASKAKKVRKTSLWKRPKNLGIKADLMSDVTCSSEE